jgi:hypothetical protein
MTPAAAEVLTTSESQTAVIQAQVQRIIEEVLGSLPDAERLSPALRRAIIARYTAVLEGNFIYWMTGAYIAARSDAARSKIMENLHEEVRDSHPAMMRRFAIAAQAEPTDLDAHAVYQSLTAMRMFIGRLQPVPILVTMAFFEGLIQRFMPYLAELASRQGSQEFEYTDVHGVCDITHTEELYRALDAELALSAQSFSSSELFEGVGLLRTLIADIVIN